MIVPQHGMAGVRLGDGEARVRDVLGSPVRRVRQANDLGRFVELRYRGLTVVLHQGGSVSAVLTRAPRERTRSGVGVGSTRAEVRQGVRGVSCPDARTCALGEFLPGRRVTVFAFRGGVVRRVTVGIVID